MTLRQRLARLEAQSPSAAPGPLVIFFCDPTTGQPSWAMGINRPDCPRHPGEPEADFIARACGDPDGPCLSPV